MKKFAFVILALIPLITFGQAEKRYRSIIVDSLKALNGGRVDVKDTLLLDSLAVYNTDLSSQYTSRSLVDSAFVGSAIAASGGNTIYNADDALAGNRIVTQGANTLDFTATSLGAFNVDGTTFSIDAFANRVGIGFAAPTARLHSRGANAATSSFAFLAEDNVGTDLFTVENNGDVGIGVDPVHDLHIEKSINGFLRLFFRNSSAGASASALFTMSNNNSATCNLEIRGSNHSDPNVRNKFVMEADNNTDGMFFVNNNAGGAPFKWMQLNSSLNYTDANTDMTLTSDGDLGLGIASPSARLHVVGDVIIDSLLSTTPKAITLGAAATGFTVFSNVLTVTGDGGGNTIGIIVGAAGTMLTLIFTDANITITDDATGAANTINLGSAFTSTANDTMLLVKDGTSWREVSRSVN